MNTHHPTLLRTPTWLADLNDETALPLPPAAYLVEAEGDRTRVTVAATGELIYAGIGPVEIVVSSAPF